MARRARRRRAADRLIRFILGLIKMSKETLLSATAHVQSLLFMFEEQQDRIDLLETTLRAALASLEFYAAERGDDPSKVPFSIINTARTVLTRR